MPALTPARCRPRAAQVLINELMPSNKQTLRDEDGATPDWVELTNTGSAAVALQARAPRSPISLLPAQAPCADERALASLPPTAGLPAGRLQGRLQRLGLPRRRQHRAGVGAREAACTCRPRARWPSAPRSHTPRHVSPARRQYLVVYLDGKYRSSASTAALHASFKLSKDGEYLALLAPDGSAASAVHYPA